jgi:hypothetical protein
VRALPAALPMQRPAAWADQCQTTREWLKHARPEGRCQTNLLRNGAPDLLSLVAEHRRVLLASVFLETEQIPVAQNRLGLGLKRRCPLESATGGFVEQRKFASEPIALDLKIGKFSTRLREFFLDEALVQLPEILLPGVLELRLEDSAETHYSS